MCMKCVFLLSLTHTILHMLPYTTDNKFILKTPAERGGNLPGVRDRSVAGGGASLLPRVQLGVYSCETESAGSRLVGTVSQQADL